MSIRWVACVSVALAAGAILPIRANAADEWLDLVRARDAGAIRARASAGEKLPNTIDAPALELAVMMSDAEVLKALLEHGVVLDRVSPQGFNALGWALSSAAPSALTVTLLLEHGMRAEYDGAEVPMLTLPGALIDPSVTRACLKAGEDPNRVHAGWSPLCMAAARGTPEVVKVLLDSGARHSDTIAGGLTALHAAATYAPEGAAKTAKHLIDAGARVDAKDQNGWTPLMLAAWKAEPDMVKALLDAGADVQHTDRRGQSVLLVTCFAGDAESVRLLLKAGADPNTPDDRGATPLWWAIQWGDPEYVRRTEIKMGRPARHIDHVTSEIERKDPTGKIKALLDAGANPNSRVSGWSPLMAAAYIWDVPGRASMLTRDDTEGARAASESKVLARFVREHDPSKLIELLIAAGAKRETGNGLTSVDIAATRLGPHRDRLLATLMNAPPGSPSTAPRRAGGGAQQPDF